MDTEGPIAYRRTEDRADVAPFEVEERARVVGRGRGAEVVGSSRDRGRSEGRKDSGLWTMERWTLDSGPQGGGGTEGGRVTEY
ncbi:hypothetical protein CRG98_023126 [Punica granatum]|uniref:Uncharacterized protein n=1 Tax=Punica granatum TaxID=22663 RepID=A0A2I0JJQ0_PUNGR|nr:hypothetical protein CRG98_023126 [Punica granatum]